MSRQDQDSCVMCLLTLPGLQPLDHKPKPSENSGRNATQLQDPATPALRGQVGGILFYYGNYFFMLLTNALQIVSKKLQSMMQTSNMKNKAAL